MANIIPDGGLATKDPEDAIVYTFDWSLNLASGVTIDAATWAITTERGTDGLAYDSDSISDQTTSARLTGGVQGSLYRVTAEITTFESPVQIKQRSFLLLCDDL